MLPSYYHRIFATVLLFSLFFMGLCRNNPMAAEEPRWKYELTPLPTAGFRTPTTHVLPVLSNTTDKTVGGVADTNTGVDTGISHTANRSVVQREDEYLSAGQGTTTTPPPAPEGAADPRTIPAVLKNDPNLPIPPTDLGGNSTLTGGGMTGTTNPNFGTGYGGPTTGTWSAGVGQGGSGIPNSSDDLLRLKALEDKMQAMLQAGGGNNHGVLSPTGTLQGGQGGGLWGGSMATTAGFGTGVHGNGVSPTWASVAIFIAVAAIGALVFAIFTAMDFRRRWLDSLMSQNQHLRVDFDVQMEEWTRPQMAMSSSSDFTGFFPKY